MPYETVKSLDPVQTIAPQTIWESLEDEAESMTTMARIILVVASIALLMAVTGVYCVLSFAVNQRTREFGIKMVLGASRAEIFRLVLLRAVKSIAIGLISGIALAEPAMLLLNRLPVRSLFRLYRFDCLCSEFPRSYLRRSHDRHVYSGISRDAHRPDADSANGIVNSGNPKNTGRFRTGPRQ